jgi:hypothetical protein
MDGTGKRHVCLERLRIENYRDLSAATQLFSFLIYELRDSGADFVHTPLLISGIHGSGALVRCQDFEDRPQLSRSLVRRGTFFLLHLFLLCGCIPPLAHPASN